MGHLFKNSQKMNFGAIEIISVMSYRIPTMLLFRAITGL